MGQVHRRDRYDDQPGLADQEGVLVGAVHGAAVLGHPQAAGGELLGDPVVEHHDAVRDVLLDPEAGQLAVDVAALAGDHRGQPLLLEPAEEATELAAHDRLVGQGAEQQLDGVEHDPLGADLGDRAGQPDEEPLEVEAAGLHELGRVEVDRVDEQRAVSLHALEVEPEAGDVDREVGGGLLEGDHHARLAVVAGTPDQELEREEGLAGARGTGHERGTPPGDAAAGDLVEAGDAGGSLLQADRSRGGRSS